jgi:hypothetical protein
MTNNTTPLPLGGEDKGEGEIIKIQNSKSKIQNCNLKFKKDLCNKFLTLNCSFTFFSLNF